MKKGTVFSLLIGIVLLLAACSNGNAVEEDASEKYTALAKDVIELLNDEEYEAVVEHFDGTMRSQMPAEMLEEEVGPHVSEAGSFEEFEKSSVEEIEGLYSVTVVAKYSEAKRIFTANYDNEDQIAGLFIK